MRSGEGTGVLDGSLPRRPGPAYAYMKPQSSELELPAQDSCRIAGKTLKKRGRGREWEAERGGR